MCGCDDLKTSDPRISDIVSRVGEQEGLTAMELAQHLAQAADEGGNLPMPQWTQSKPPEKPNVYSDGSVHNPRSSHRQVEASASSGQAGALKTCHAARQRSTTCTRSK